jgi:SsrA-binding protein
MAKKKTPSGDDKSPRTIVNRRARYDYEFLATHEAGVALAGSEVKSVFLGKVNMTDAYCRIQNGEIWLVNLDIEPYAHAAHFQPERRRERKLLMHRKEIDLLERKSQEKGLALIPSAIYFKNGRVKVEIALARGKRQYDKREQIAKDEQRREAERARTMKLR